MWDTLTWKKLGAAAVSEDLEAFREGALRFFLWIAIAGYLAWHIATTLALTGDSIRHWVLLPIVLGVCLS